MSNIEMTVEALKRCVDPDAFANAMEQVSGIKPEQAQKKAVQWPVNDINRECRRLLTELGMPPHIKGCRCAATAIRVLVENPDLLDSITKGLYPAVAEVHTTTPSRVERAIRHGVECVWDRGDLDALDRYFGNTVSIHKGKPTNSEFLATCAAIIRERMQDAQDL